MLHFCSSGFSEIRLENYKKYCWQSFVFFKYLLVSLYKTNMKSNKIRVLGTGFKTFIVLLTLASQKSEHWIAAWLPSCMGATSEYTTLLHSKWNTFLLKSNEKRKTRSCSESDQSWIFDMFEEIYLNDRIASSTIL